MHKLEADGIELILNNRKILGDIYIKTETGSVVGLLARNGEGKTCLMKVIYGCLKANNHSVRIDETPAFEVFKKPELLTYLPQFNFIPCSLTLRRVFKDFEICFSDFEICFPEFNGRKNEKISNLSGGQRRLTEVYLLIKSKTKFTMLDEPFSHVMPLHIEKLVELISKEKQNKGFILTDHMYRHVLKISDEIYVLANGKTHHTKCEKDIESLGYING